MNAFERYYELFPQYRTPGFEEWKVNHSVVLNSIKQLENSFETIELGLSFEGRTIHAVCWGKGDRTLLFWTQMHGDEPTATKSIFDILNFLNDNSVESARKKEWSEQFRLIFVPMLNPDGAERWQRENAQMIDLNRDARRKTTPEAQILAGLYDRFAPQWAFNLHDQNSYYAAGKSKIPATITLLAPPIDDQDTAVGCRLRAMLLIGRINRWLQKIIPGGVAKWNDDFEPRAFGEWYQQKGVSTVLVESGSYPGDPNREMARRLNFALLLATIDTIPTRGFMQETAENYYKIPLNNSDGIFDRIERSVTIEQNGQIFVTDRGYRNEEVVLGDLEQFGEIEIPTKQPYKI